MTLHLYMNYKCPECETPYIPYNSAIPCPKCGDQPEMEDYPEFVDGICESFLYNLSQNGNFTPMCWAVCDISDSIQMFFFGLFDKWKNDEMINHEPQERTAAFTDFLKSIMGKVDVGGEEMEHMKGYIEELALAVYDEFFNVREIDLAKKMRKT